MQDLLQITLPLKNLLKKAMKFEWKDKCEAVF